MDVSCSRYRRAGLEAESKAAWSCSASWRCASLHAPFFQTALCGEWWKERQERFVWDIGDVYVDWLGNYPNLGFSIHWFPEQQGVTDA